jgi:hypothetical protein
MPSARAYGPGADRTVLRPRRARAVVYPTAALVAGVFLAMAVLLPWSGRGAWGLGSRVALVALGAAVVWFLHRLAAVRVETDEDGVRVVNVLLSRRLEWAEVIGVRLASGDAWMMLDLSDGGTLAAMGVQKADGRYGQEQARAFARMVAERSRTERDD